MKLLIITGVKAYEKEVLRLFKKAQIHAFSSGDIKGFKSDDHENLIDNWFSGSTDRVRSVLFFTFEAQQKVELLLEQLKEFNREVSGDNPIKAVVLPIESYV